MSEKTVSSSLSAKTVCQGKSICLDVCPMPPPPAPPPAEKPHYTCGNAYFLFSRAAVLLVLFGAYLQDRDSAFELHFCVDRTRKGIKIPQKISEHRETAKHI